MTSSRRRWARSTSATARVRPRRASVRTSRWCRRTRPGRFRSRPGGTAHTATRSRGSSHMRATTSSASTTTTTRAVSSTSSARRSRRRGAGRSRPRTAIEATLERFRIHFDTFSLQSTLERELPELLERLPTYERDGAVWIRSTEFGDERDRVLIRSAERGGTPTYEAADIAYLRDKLERGFERVMYVLGADHFDVRGWYAVIARMLGYDPLRVEVLLYQLVHLTRGGEQTRMSKRRGNIVTLDEFMDEVGVDAARWYLVNRGPDQTIEIDVDLAAEKTQKNPVYYVQYAHARIAGILRNAGDAELSAELAGPLAVEEREL